MECEARTRLADFLNYLRSLRADLLLGRSGADEVREWAEACFVAGTGPETLASLAFNSDLRREEALQSLEDYASEFGLAPTTRREAAIDTAVGDERAIVEGGVSPFEGASRIAKLSSDLGHSLPTLTVFVYLVDLYADALAAPLRDQAYIAAVASDIRENALALVGLEEG